MQATCTECEVWTEFLHFARERCSSAAFDNWLAPIKVIDWTESEVVLEVPNIFVQEYLLSNYKSDLCDFLPSQSSGRTGDHVCHRRGSASSF